MIDVETSGPAQVSILLVEDSADDALLVERQLASIGAARIERVESADAMREALGRDSWDAVVSDYCLPLFDGLAALEIAREHDRIMPFILVSATVPRQVAIDAMHSGANDFVMKHELERLAPALLRELRGARAQREVAQFSGRTAARRELEGRLRGAIERNELSLHYQPKIELKADALVGFEALLRWQDAKLGRVSPDVFVPVLEETGLIIEVGAWAVRKALEDQSSWRRDAGASVPVAVNVSSVQLHRDDFVETIASIVADFDGWRLELEVTESVLARDVEGCAAKLRRLAAMGIGISIDDFGTGYSSLAYLCKLPVNAIKLDRAFVTAMATERHGRSLLGAIVMMARSLELATVAEGIETSDQLRAVRVLGCSQVQGFLTGRPMPAGEVAGFLRGGAPD